MIASWLNKLTNKSNKKRVNEMIEISLTQNKTALIDNSFSFVADYNWQYDQKTGYAKRKFTVSTGKRKTVYLHKYIYELMTGETLNGKTHVVDHEDNNRLNCQAYNLRKATYSENAVNKITKTGKSGKRGVSQSGMKFIAKIQYQGVTYKLGKFDTAEEAFEAYNKKSKELRGKFHKEQK